MCKSFIILLNLFVLIQYATSYKILGVFPMACHSHYVLASKLMKEALQKVNILEGYYVGKAHLFEKITKLMYLFENMTNATLHHPKVKTFLQSNASFDVVIISHLFNDANKVFAHVYKCPLISLVPHGTKGWINSVVGNPNLNSYVPHMFLHGDIKMIFQRMKNMFYFMTESFCHHFFYMPTQENILHSAFSETPSVSTLRNNVSIALLNSHTSIYQSMPTVPNMIEIGGYHIDPPKKLPGDIQQFLDGATEGAIYFSLGSHLLSKDMPKSRIEIILSVLGRLKQKVLWKFESESLIHPENVLVRKWMPQNDILAHPNIRLFITHAGLLSILETIYHGVPILAIPVFFDQPMNALKAVQSGYGLSLNYFDTNFNEETLSKLINELLNNKKYKQNALKVSHIFHDRPLTPMENAIYWVEYAIRQNNAEHLRVAGVNLV